MSNNYLLNLKINSLQSELDALSVFTGYTYVLNPTGGGLIDGNSFEAPQGNNTAYAVSSVNRKEPWTITFNVSSATTNNVFVGVSQDPSRVFPNASSPSMQMVDFGLLIDRNGNNTGLLEIVDGVFAITAYQLGTSYKLTYDGTAITVFINNIQIYTRSVSLNPVYLVVGSFNGGQVDNISFEGDGSGGSGGTLNLQQVLANGDDAGNESIKNVNELTVNGGALFGSGLSILQNQQIRLTTDTNQSIQLYGSPSTPQFNITHSGDELLTINTSSMVYSFGYQDLNKPSIPTLKIQGVANDTTFEGIILDSTINPPSAFIASILTNQTTKNINSGSPTSILKIDTGAYNFYNAFSSVLTSLSFQNNIVGANPGTSIVALFYLSDTLDGDVDSSTPLYVGFTTSDINPLGGIANVSASKVVLSNIFNEAAPLLYLNVKIASANPCVCVFDSFNINMNTQAEVNYKLTIAPSIL